MRRSDAEMLDVLTRVDGAREPVGAVALAVPFVPERVAVFRHGGIGDQRLFERFKRNAKFIHATTDPQDQPLTSLTVEVERPMFLSLFHNVPITYRITRPISTR